MAARAKATFDENGNPIRLADSQTRPDRARYLAWGPDSRLNRRAVGPGVRTRRQQNQTGNEDCQRHFSHHVNTNELSRSPLKTAPPNEKFRPGQISVCVPRGEASPAPDSARRRGAAAGANLKLDRGHHLAAD